MTPACVSTAAIVGWMKLVVPHLQRPALASGGTRTETRHPAAASRHRKTVGYETKQRHARPPVGFSAWS
jgi:hypothetical protein